MRVMEARRWNWIGHVAWMEEIRDAHKILSGFLQG
jgi:hypothetical protein